MLLALAPDGMVARIPGFHTGYPGPIPGQGTKILLQATTHCFKRPLTACVLKIKMYPPATKYKETIGTKNNCMYAVGENYERDTKRPKIQVSSMKSWWQKEDQFNSVQLLSHVQLFATPWTATHQASLSITNSQSLLRLMSIESMMPFNHIILCCPLLHPPSIIPASESFQMSQFFTSNGQSIGASASVSVLPKNIQD